MNFEKLLKSATDGDELFKVAPSNFNVCDMFFNIMV
jgi:hypothetical protein